jgi:flagellar hook assembly protein FlgD
LNDAIGSHLAVFDVAGRRIRKLEIESARAYSGQVRWDGRDEEGRDVPPGTYFLRLTSDNGAAVTERVTIVR